MEVESMREIPKLLERDGRVRHEQIAAPVGIPMAEFGEQIAAWERSGVKKYKDDGDIFAESEADHRLMVTP